MSTKRNLPPVPDVPSQASNKHLKSRNFIDPSLVLEGLKQPAEMTSDQAVVWLREVMEAALTMNPAPEPRQQKVGAELSSSGQP